MVSAESIQFISQREQSCYPDDSCHVACLKMLLDTAEVFSITYSELCSELKIDSCEIDGYDFSAEEIVKFLVRSHLNFRLIFQRDEWQNSLKQSPIMVGMFGGTRFWGREGHAIVLVALEDGIFTYLDPWSMSSQNYIKKIDFESFYKHYSGFACQIYK